ncbi:MAG: DNA repair protein RecO [Sphingobacteriales bacterium]|nr:MAG: DNA repair protein RecO [Sphingobacteriales bacterium]
MLHKTKGIVVKTVKYGETSVIATMYTELFGIQSFMINGVRSSAKSAAGKANLLQPAAILDLVMYHNDKKNLQRLKEFRWATLYKDMFYNVIKNSIALFMVELLQKTLKEPEVNPELFSFIEDAFVHLDEAADTVMANYPLFFALHLTSFYGFRFSDTWTETRSILDLREGEFISTMPQHPYFLEGNASFVTSQLLKVQVPAELTEIKLNKEMRRSLLQSYQLFYALHLSDFGTMKTLPVLQEVIG